LHWLPTLIVAVNTAFAGLFTYEWLVGSSHHATATTGLYGSILLVLCLVPANVLRIKRLSRVSPLWASIRFLAGLRMSLGISAGVWFAAHTVVGLTEYFDLSSGVPRQFLIGDMLVGVVAMVVFAALLLTSNDASQRFLGKSWKPLQRLVWFAVPLALVHTVFSAVRLHHFETTPVWFMGALVVFAGSEYLAFGRRGRGARGRSPGKKAWTHAGLVVAGTAAAVIIYAVSWGAVGPWEFERERPAGPPPDGAMEKGPPPKGG
jgi:DMSO/TMAO reductase YedYZ heme-binding membrane subunit